MDTTGKSAARQAAERLREALDGRYQGKQYHTQATITAVARDSAGRAVSATAIVDGVAAQSVAISAGASIAPGDTWIVRNAGGASLPRWEATRRLRAAAEVQAPDALPTLPTPAGLAVLSDLYRTAAGGEWRAYLRCSWLGIGAQYRVMGYDVQYMSGSPETLTVITATDRHPVTLLDGAIDDTQTVIPRDPDEAGYQDDFPSFGRIQIESERIDYLAVTAGEGDSGTGTGAANSFTDGTKSWDADQWADYALTDSAGDVFLVTANTGTVLTVAGTPASGAYTIKPAFSGCTRAAGGTAAAAHDDDTGVGSLSVGITIPELPPDTDYNVRVRAHSAFGGLSAWTAWASVTTAVDTLPPPVLTGMAHTPLTPDTVRLSWSKSSAKDLAYYEVAYSMAPGGLGPGGVYETVQTVNAFLDLGWPTNRALYWKVRAVDTWDNEGDYCAEQTAYTVSVALPELSNPFFEEGNGAPDDWTLDSDGPVTTTWVASGGWNNSKAIKIEIGAANGADEWFTALKSAIFEIQQGVEYLSPGASTYLAAVTANALAFTVYQYSDAIGTPATEPLVRQVVNQSSDRLNDWWHPGITVGGTYTVPAGSDVTHIAIAFEVNLDETHAQTVLLDNAVCDPVPAEMYKGVEAHATYHLPGGPDALATAAANTIVPDAGAAEGSAASFARSDHTHAIACAAASTLSVSTTNSEGAATSFARSDHAHEIATSSDPGTEESILASDASGGLTLVNLDLSGNLSTARVASDLIPELTDTYDLGTSDFLWRKGWLSELDAVLFAQNTKTLLGGWFSVGPGEGTFPADVAAGDTAIDFGQEMTPGHFVEIQAAGKVEFMQVGALVSGTTYNVTRNLDGTGANDWPAGTVYAINGASGAGRIELNAYDTPRLNLILQGATYNAKTEIIRLGDLNGNWGYSSTKYGLAIGQYAAGKTNITLDQDGAFRIRLHATERIGLTAAGVLSIKDSGGNAVFTFNAAQGAEFTKFLSLGANGGIYQGGYQAGHEGDPAYPEGGLKMYRDPTGYGVIHGFAGRVWSSEFGPQGVRVFENYPLRFARQDPSRNLLATIGVQSEYNYWYDRLTLRVGYYGPGIARIAATTTGGTENALLTLSVNHDTDDGHITLGTNGTNKLGVTPTYIYTECDLRVEHGLYVGSRSVDPAADWIYADGGLYVGDTANANQTKGLTINQGSATDEILALKNSGVAHGITDITETDTWGVLKPNAGGGIWMMGVCDANGGDNSALLLDAILYNAANKLKSTSALGVITLRSRLKSGTSVQDVGTNGNLMVLRNRATTRFIFDAEGDLHLDGTSSAYDDHDDLALLHGFRAAAAPELRQRWGQFIEQARPVLEATGVATFNPNGEVWYGVRGLQMLTIDALRQFAERTEARLERYERELIRLGADPQALLN